MITYSVRVAYALLRGAVSRTRRRGREAAAGIGGAENENQSGFSAKHTSMFYAHPFDLDIQGHVNNSKFLHIAELTRWRVLAEDGLLGFALKNKWLFLATRCDIKYRAPIPPFKRYACTVETSHDSKKWIQFKHQFKDLDTGKVYADLNVTAVIKHTSGKTVHPSEYEQAANGVR